MTNCAAAFWYASYLIDGKINIRCRQSISKVPAVTEGVMQERSHFLLDSTWISNNMKDRNHFREG